MMKELMGKGQSGGLGEEFFRGCVVNGCKEGFVEELIKGEFFEGYYQKGERNGSGKLIT